MAGTWAQAVGHFGQGQQPPPRPVTGKSANPWRLPYIVATIGWISKKLKEGTSPAELISFLDLAYGVELIETHVPEAGKYVHPGTGKVLKLWGGAMAAVRHGPFKDMASMTAKAGANSLAKVYVLAVGSPERQDVLQAYCDLANEV